MSKTRIFLSNEISLDSTIKIENQQHHLIKNVLRMKIDDKVNIFDGISGEWNSKIISINKKFTNLKVVKKISAFSKSPDTWVIFAPIKQQRMSIAIQKATELGATTFIPCITEYTNIRKVNFDNLRANAIEASEQSERLDIPIFKNVIKLDQLFINWPNDRMLIFCDEKSNSDKDILQTLIPYYKKFKKWSIIIGPEGGFSDKERDFIISNNKAISVSLGKRVLRSDTAITVSLFAINEILSNKS